MLGHPQGIDAYLRQTWRIVPDPDDVEFIAAPVHQIRMAQQHGYFSGDCDDAATLAAALLAALEWPCTIVAIRLPNYYEYSHVFVRCDGFDIDPIVPPHQLPIVNYAESMEVSL